MKIAFFTDNYLPQASGVATSVDYFAKSLRKNGHLVSVFAPKVKGFKDKDPDVFRLPSIRIVPSLPDGARLPLPNNNILKIIREDFDIIHAHGNGAFSLLGLGVARAKKIPFASTFHIQVGNFAHKGKILKPKMMDKLFLKKFSDYCDGVISPSQKMERQLIEAGVRKEIALIPNFVDLDQFKKVKKGFLRKKCKISKSSPILLSCGRVGREKNFGFLIRSFVQVVKEYPKAHLIIVGPNWGEMEKLKKLSKTLNLSKRVHFIGQIKNGDMPKVYKDADIFVFASKSEVHPMVIIEAAASGLPLVVVDDLAYKGVVVNAKNGFIASDEEEFTKAICKILKNPALKLKFSQNSAKLVGKRFGSKILTNKLLAFYQKTIKTALGSV